MMTNQDKTLLIVTPSSPNGGHGEYFPVPLAIAGDPTFDLASSSGGWQIIERPKQKAATQWYDRAPYELVVDAIIDPSVTHSSRRPEQDVKQILSWVQPPTLHAAVIQPPTLHLRGPVMGTDLTWVVYTIKWGAAIRVPPSGHTPSQHTPGALRASWDQPNIASTPLSNGAVGSVGAEARSLSSYGPPGSIVQQMLTLTFYEYVPPFPTRNHKSSPAKLAARGGRHNSAKIYIVKTGDTLASITAKELGRATAANERAIIDANKGDATLKFRSPGQVLSSMVGKRIKIPVL